MRANIGMDEEGALTAYPCFVNGANIIKKDVVMSGKTFEFLQNCGFRKRKEIIERILDGKFKQN